MELGVNIESYVSNSEESLFGVAKDTAGYKGTKRSKLSQKPEKRTELV